ncbi:hypothetical protein AKJ57_05565 [candidate division MSBL1 archaeon SCGC-AAA259A05]|uniref:Uncharacterized protein n=1 Tax=candidate division MSBL1 archaeon SCGC-AAA259A05 TaxID=1698259 RepID=A0A133U505_9EURY|nr:hypothetical protein AKJ57_05565 [candidate division MSBL1 archaeon SCGC-AAA259A05]
MKTSTEFYRQAAAGDRKINVELERKSNNNHREIHYKMNVRLGETSDSYSVFRKFLDRALKLHRHGLDSGSAGGAACMSLS